MKISEPGVYQMTAEEYHADCCETPSLSCSIAKVLISKSPLHAWLQHARLSPNAVSKEKESFDIGSAAHALLLEGIDRMAVLPFDDYRTSAAKAARDAARLTGKHPVLEAKSFLIRNMIEIARQAFLECADIGYAWEDGKPEQVIIWRDRGGIMCRMRADWLSSDLDCIVDYKSTTDSAPSVFNRQISRMNYHIQDAFYRRGLSAITGRENRFFFMAQELEEPFACSFHAVAPSLSSIADDLVERAIVTFAGCLQNDVWPGYTRRVHYAEAETWQLREHEARGYVEAAAGIPFAPEKAFDKAER